MARAELHSAIGGLMEEDSFGEGSKSPWELILVPQSHRDGNVLPRAAQLLSIPSPVPALRGKRKTN